MKKLTHIFTLVTALMMLSGQVFATEDQDRMSLADSAYQKEDYAAAVELYEQIVADGNEGAILFYNLGNAYYKCGNNPKALLWYERALKLDPSDEDIQHNIAFVNQKITDKIDALPETLLTKIGNKTENGLTETQWAWISILCSFLLIGCITTTVFSKSYILRRVGFVLFWIALLLFILSLVFASMQKKNAEEKREAIVMELVVEAKNQPNAGGKELFVIHEGLKVQITNEMNGWVEIRIPNGEKGWVTENVIEKI